MFKAFQKALTYSKMEQKGLGRKMCMKVVENDQIQLKILEFNENKTRTWKMKLLQRLEKAPRRGLFLEGMPSSGW